jgi:hypothetical protein
MFGWFKNWRAGLQRRVPSSGHLDWGIPGIIPSGNPSTGAKFKVAFSSETHSWEEEPDLTSELAKCLTDHGHLSLVLDGYVTLPSCGLRLKPGFVNHTPLDDGQGTNSVTTIEISHTFAFPPVFEYQHAQADTMRKAVQHGFSDWIKFDLPVFLDSLRIKPERCTCIESPYPMKDGRKRWRRVLLGPTKFTTSAPPDTSVNSGHPPGCDCCLFTDLFHIMNPLMEAKGFCAVRLVTVSDPPEEAATDFRINGEDFMAGAVALLESAQKRSGAHFEFRRQLILIQDWYDRPEDG